MVEGLRPRNSFFCHQNDNFGCIFTQFLTGRSFGTRILRFNRETKFTITVQKLSKNKKQNRGGVVVAQSRSPEDATDDGIGRTYAQRRVAR